MKFHKTYIDVGWHWGMKDVQQRGSWQNGVAECQARLMFYNLCFNSSSLFELCTNLNERILCVCICIL